MPVLTIPRVIATWVSLAILAGAIYLLWSWSRGDLVLQSDGGVARERETWRLVVGLALLAWSLLGRSVVLMFIPGKAEEPRAERGRAMDVKAPDGARLRADSFGQEGAPTLILTHGWGLNGTAWWRTVRNLKDRFRLITWDLPGLGRSDRPRYGLSLEYFAQSLGAVVEASGERDVVLVGHSIGGMTTETFWRACPPALRRRVAGVVLVNTTYVDPLKTMWLHRLWTTLERPLIEPLNKIAVVLSPLLWLSAWQSYLSGSSQLAMRLTGFGRYASRGEVDFAARLACKGSPAVQAKGNLAMFRWSAEDVLPQLDVPVLILSGEKDIVTLPEASVRMAQAMPHAQLIEAPGAGHMGFMERSDLYSEAIADFAEEAFRRGGRDEGETDGSSAEGFPLPPPRLH